MEKSKPRPMKSDAIKVAQEIVARRVQKDRDLVAELIAERRKEVAVELQSHKKKS